MRNQEDQEVLDVIRKRLIKGAVTDLWNVLSALRGPDAGIESSEWDGGEMPLIALKRATTDVIRFHAFPNLSYFPADYEADNGAQVEVRKSISGNLSGNHFITHAQLAFYALGLKWEQVNPDPPKEKP